MSRICTVCSHPQRTIIEAAIIAQVSNRNIAKQFSIGYSSVVRHAKEHIADTIKQSQSAQNEVVALSAANELKWVNEHVHGIYDTAIAGEKPNLKLALQATGEIRRWAELWAELEGELNRGMNVELNTHPDWLNMREIIFAALEPYPDARRAVARALLQAGGQNANSHIG